MRVSIVIPFYNEEESVEEVLREVCGVMPDAEVLAVDDGSDDSTAEKISNHAKSSNVRYLGMAKNCGQSAALYLGLHHASGDVCVMMDGDGQNDPADIPALLERSREMNIVCGYRKTRQDNWQKKVASRIANNIRSSFLQDGVRDTGCTLKVIRKEHVKQLVPFNALHRFLPALLKNAGVEVIEVPVNHRPRKRGISKYTVAGRAWKGIYDLIGVSWLLTRQVTWSINPYSTEV
ncbi:MAG: glycosyltransferase family 2 protein [Verrucomicrobiota bacterium]